MKIRTDFVTNSSSSSFIICFARIEDMEKAKPILKKYNINPLTAKRVGEEVNSCGELGADWAGAIIYEVDKIIEKHPDDLFIIIEDSNEAEYDEDDQFYEPIYNYDFNMNDAIDSITTNNGFTNIDVAEGEGRDG